MTANRHRPRDPGRENVAFHEPGHAVVAACRGRAEPNLTRLGTALETYGRCLVGLGSPADAEPVLRELPAVLETFPPGHWGRSTGGALVGGALAGRKKFADAEPLLLRGYEAMMRLAETIPPEDRRNLPDAADRLVELYTATNQPDASARWRAERAKYPVGEAAPPRVKE